ncbi:MAG: epoxyqueuosine reductase QueH [Lachnospiraceae bacterium]|nr:epoxyqueuosine reductase QueH [Lachnospiraceae bacterium]
MNAPNYQKELEKLLVKIEQSEKERGEVPTLFLHSCCAPCSSYVLKYLRSYFKITVFYYNPNISEQEEYRKRVEEQKRLIGIYNAEAEEAKVFYSIEIVEGEYEPEVFFDLTREQRDCPEGGKRCFLCYELRLRKTAEYAVAAGFDYFATTLSISPLKNAAKLNEIGEKLSQEIGVKWLPSDFKKKEGYKQSIELSREYGLYRQNYCGCVYSKKERVLAR